MENLEMFKNFTTLGNGVKIVNLTPHDVNLVREDGSSLITIKAEEKELSARCSQTTEIVDCLGGVPITRSTFGEVVGLPEAREGVFFIVSRIVLSACPERRDLLVPNELMRNDKGQVIGCKSLANN